MAQEMKHLIGLTGFALEIEMGFFAVESGYIL